VLVIVMFMLGLFQPAHAGESDPSAVRSETLLRSSSSGDGESYHCYLAGAEEQRAASMRSRVLSPGIGRSKPCLYL